MTTRADGFLQTLLGARTHAGAQPGWLARLRADALERANALGVPTPRDEDWRFTDLAPLTRASFQPVQQPAAVDAGQMRERFLAEAGARLVFVDGLFVPELSQRDADPAGVVVELQAALRGSQSAALEARLGKLARADASVFAALNTAFLGAGATILLPADATLADPIHILHVATSRSAPHAIYPRALIVAGARSRATIVEDFVALDDAAYFSAPVTEVALERDAAIAHVRLQRESDGGFHLGTCAVTQATGSRYSAVAVACGARLSRLDWSVVHAEPGCETALDGLALIDGRQLADTHSKVDHAHPGGRLRQLHKCVVGGSAHAVFNGAIFVRAGAQQTDAAQSCRGLLLSERARIDAKPQLEIFADDVKCAHGAAIGQLDPEHAFYLQSRGLGAQQARSLLTYAFAAEVIGRVPVASVARARGRALVSRTLGAV